MTIKIWGPMWQAECQVCDWLGDVYPSIGEASEEEHDCFEKVRKMEQRIIQRQQELEEEEGTEEESDYGDVPATVVRRGNARKIVRTEWRWPKDRSKVTHKFVKGAMAGDGALCGAPSDSTIANSLFANDPRCQRCVKLDVAIVEGTDSE